MGFLDLLDSSNDPEFFWQVISGPPCIKIFAEIIENVQNEFYYLLGYCQDLQGQHLNICCKNYSCLSKLKFSLFSNNQIGFFRKFLM
jgi:hypothetical protein